jgi:tetratricopeptide (TPR) repeat protein
MPTDVEQISRPTSEPAPDRPPARRWATLIAAAGALCAAALVAGAIGVARPDPSADDAASASRPVIEPDATAVAPLASAGSLDELISSLEARLAASPGDHASWAALGLAYVQQAEVTEDASFYDDADEALTTAIGLDEENHLAYAGLSALAAARHDFPAARSFAERGLEINPYSATLHGTLSDAELQLGNYDEAFDAAQQMLDLSPDTASFARASYTWELSGDVERATALMQRALDAARTDSDRAFALVHLGGLAFANGDPGTALGYYNRALEESPEDLDALFGKAKAEAAQGQVETALDHHAELVERAPDLDHVVAYGELLESLGRVDEAEALYGSVRDVGEVDVDVAAPGAPVVGPDVDTILFEANHGDPATALALAEAGLEVEPFVTMHDAHAWALHVNGRHEEALDAIGEAMQLGERNARFSYHAGMIRLALGDAEGARSDLTEALAINPWFHPLEARVAEATLFELGGPVNLPPR